MANTCCLDINSLHFVSQNDVRLLTTVSHGPSRVCAGATQGRRSVTREGQEDAGRRYGRGEHDVQDRRPEPADLAEELAIHPGVYAFDTLCVRYFVRINIYGTHAAVMGGNTQNLHMRT